MIKFKKLLSIAFIGLLLLGAYSCDQEAWLETTDKTNLTDATMWASNDNADIYLNDCYDNLAEKSNQADNIDNFTSDNDAGFYYTSYNFKKGIVEASSGGSLNGYSIWFGTTGFARYGNWPQTYQFVRKLNTFIAKVNENSENFDADWMAKRIDEAKFLRAWFYYEAFIRMGGLSIITEPQDRQTMTEAEMYVSRNTFEETFNFIISELTTIINNGNLEVRYDNGDSDAGRATLGAALALKGWLQLWAASPAFNSADPAVPNTNGDLQSFATPNATRWADALATNKQFVDTWGHLGTGDFDLWSDMTTFWYAENEYNCEVVWDRQHVATTMANTFDTYGGPVWIHNTYYTWGNYCPTNELVEQYQMANGLDIDDPASGYDDQNPYVGRENRFYQFIVYDGAPYKQDWMSSWDTIYTRIDEVHPSKNQIDYGADDVGNTAYYFKKRLDHANPRGGRLCGDNHVYLRYGFVLLNYAEAENEVNGPTADCYAAVNAIRQRPGTDLPPLPAGLTKNEMRDAIHHERRIELVYEGYRFWDMQRWKDLDYEMNLELHGMTITNSVPSDNSGVWVYTPTTLNHPHVFTTKMYFTPIPQGIIDRNETLVQNYGY